MKVFVGISGASGSVYGGRLLKALKTGDHDVTACVSDNAVEVMRWEEKTPGLDLSRASREVVIENFLFANGLAGGDIDLVLPGDFASAFASGSYLAAAVIVCPCSMSTAASIAAGITGNLIHRAADVMLKEGRQLALVPRETPLSEIHLENLLKLRRAGAHVIPAMPGFYHKPETVEDLVDFVAGKVLDVLGLPHELYDRWDGS